MKKKFSLGLLAAGLIAAGVLAGCGGGGDKSSDNPGNSSSSNLSSFSSNSESLSGQGATTSSHLPDSSSILPPSSSSSTPASSSSTPAPSSSSSSSSSKPADFSFTVALSSGSNTLNKGEEAHIVINETGGDPSVTRTYSYASSNRSVIRVSNVGTVTAVEKGENVRITIRETGTGKQQYLMLNVIDASPAEGGYNFASLSGSEAISKRTEILGSLEKYAVDNHLTGITLFENSGYVKYRERVTLPTTNYITGYGFGLLSEGTIDNDNISHEDNPNHKMYYHSAISQDPMKINARNDTGAQVSDLEGYITYPYWGTKLNATKDGYEWFPALAKDTVTYSGVTTPFNRPIPVYQDQEVAPGQPEANPLGLYNTWRIYVKTGAGVKYRYNGTAWGDKVFDGREVTLADYEFAYRFLLTGSHQQVRGTEMAGDETYGIVGALRYNTNTKDVSDEIAKNTWNEMVQSGELGIKTGNDPVNGDYIQLTILNPIDRFTAMYTLSSNLYSPIPEEFLETIGEGSVKVGAGRYGKTNNGTDAPSGHQDMIVDYVLSVGPYMLESWVKNQALAFKRNETWIEPGRYNIAGLKILVIDTAQSSTKIYERFLLGDLDSCGIPQKFIATEVGQPRVYKTKGDSTFKLNVNSCDEATFNYLFGPAGKIAKNTDWDLKPWMSNDNFLNGLFYSINRKEFAGNRGSEPSINYFSDAYLSDPENGISYNSTQAHKDAVKAYQVYDSNGESTYGYSYDRAVSYFKAAVKEMVAQSVMQYGQNIHIHIRWMYPTDLEDYGNAIAKYFTDAFNDPAVCGGQIKLIVDQDAVPVWDQVYNEYMMKGKFDLGFGAISGNTYNPLNFLQVLKSDNESGFTLNWGTDTSKVTADKPLIYDDKIWSFDALWAVSDHGGIVKNGEIAKTIEKCYLRTPTQNELYNGYSFDVIAEVIDSDSANVNLEGVSIYIYGSGSQALTFTNTVDGNIRKGSISFDAAFGEAIDNEIRRVNHMDDRNKYPSLYKDHAFTLENYNVYWTVEISYSLAIKPAGSSEFGTPTLSYFSAAKNINDVPIDQEVKQYET